MKEPTEAPAVEHLIALCLELYEGRGPGAVDEVLRQHPDSSDRVRERLDMLGRMGLVGEAPVDSRPDRIGDYAILDVLGRGGMGVVYEARQERPRRRVALKVLRTLPTGDGLHRFRHEAELLGRLQHPGIAQVYEVSTAPVGGMTVPFFAMELVRGRTIDEYVREEGLDVRARLELVARVADAVHHAHQKGVVHRDLKPANILVDERGAPRILDFGIARTLDPDLRLETLRTEVGQLVGTLAYMSPEQAAGKPQEIDSRTDVYSLGVVAYELLTGVLPHDTADLSVLQTLRAIQEDEAPRLSQTDRALRGDVETIVAKALAKEKERRYSSAHELAADLRRYLHHEPITARPATALYQIARFSRRHRALVGGAVAFVLALALGVLGTLNGLVTAARERDDAERRFRQANAVLGFQKRMFAAADPDQEGVLVEDLLDRGVLMLDEDADPVELATLKLMLGEAFESIGVYAKAESLTAAAVGTFERELGPEDLQTLSARTILAHLYGHPMGRFDDAEAALDGVADIATRAHGPAHEVTLAARLVQTELDYELGRHAEAVATAHAVLELIDAEHPLWIEAKSRHAKSLNPLGEVEAALAIAREVYARNLEAHGREHPESLKALSTLASMLIDEGRGIEGRQLLAELMELRLKHLGPSHPDTLNTMTKVCASHVARSELDEAEELALRTLEMLENKYSLDHPGRLFTLNTLGFVYMLQGRLAEAESAFREGLVRTRDLRGPEHIATVTSMANLAQALQRQGRRDEAEELYVEALEIRRRNLGTRNIETLVTMSNYGHFLTRGGRYAEGEALLREAAETGRDVLGPENEDMSEMLHALGWNLVEQERFEEAEPLLLESLDWAERTENLRGRRNVLRSIQTLYLRWGFAGEAAHYKTLLAEPD